MSPAVQIEPIDAEVREEIRTNVGENLLVEAGAGTGKTTSLVGRIVEILATGHATVDELAVITFTHKAAAELSARVREALEAAIEVEVDESRRVLLSAAVRGLYRARIETIHSFATALLRERPVEAGLDPEFRALGELEESLLFDQRFGDWLADLLAEPRPEIETAVNLGLGPDEIKQAARLVHDHRYLLPLQPAEVPPADGSEVADWIEANRDELQGIASRCNNEEHAQVDQIQKVLDFRERLGVEGTSAPSLARLVARGMPGLSLGGGSQNDWDDPRDCQRWKKELGREFKDLAGRVPVAMRTAALVDLLPLIEEFVRGYERDRREEGLADFDDLIIWARDLVRDRPGVREYFRRRFRALLIDEFQDTDPIQVELAMLLASDGDVSDWRKLKPVAGKLFVVGDPKQSIYRFRRADIGIYDEVKAGLLAAGLRELVQNFRSVPGVIEWVNHAFDRLFEERPGLQPKNVPLRESGFEQGLARPPVVVLRHRDPEANAPALREQEAEAVAAVLHGAVRGAQRWPVRDRVDGELHDPCWRDVAILLPRRTGLEAYEEALAAIGIPYRHEGSRDYFEREEVRDLVFLLRAIDDPRDRISLIGALRSGAFGCSDDDLVIHAATVESGFPWNYRARSESDSERVMEAFELLRGLHYAREKLSLPLLVQRAVAESRLVEAALTGRDGPQAAANLLAIVEQARAFASAGGGSPRAFTRWLADNTEREASEVDAGIAEETDDVVRIMTMHGAKGLEFPIVVLGGLGGSGRSDTGPVPDEADQRLHFYIGSKAGGNHFPTPGYEERSAAEKEALALEDIRLLYVAATRARDHLLIPDFVGKRSPGPLLAALEPLLPDRDAHEEAVEDVWMLEADRVERPTPVEEERRRVKAGEAKAALADRDAWSGDREVLIKDARNGLELEVASSVKRTVRPLAAEASHSDAAMLVSEGPPLEIGDALHLVMQRVSLPDADDLERITGAIAEEAGIPEHEGEIVGMARRCLASPVVQRALASPSYQREVPFTIPADAGYLVGRVDLVFPECNELVLVDYKTDMVEAEGAQAHAESHFAGQAESYLDGLQAASRRPVTEIVFVYCRPGVEVILAAHP